MSIKVLVPLAGGFEEIEAITIVDVLRRAGIAVDVVSLDSLHVKGAHQIVVHADLFINQINGVVYDAIVLPGGMPGSAHLRDSDLVLDFVRAVWTQGGHACAICAAPIALHAAGLLDGVQATSYPSFADQLSGAIYCEDEVVCDGRVVTSRGAGTALAFSFRLLEELDLAEQAAQLRKGMLAE